MERDTLYINGEWRPSTSNSRIDVVNPATEKVIGYAPASSTEDVDAAVAAASAAFPTWSEAPVAERVALLNRLADDIEAHAEEFAQTITTEFGAPITASRAGHVGRTIEAITTNAAFAANYRDGERVGPLAESKLVHEPVGVVGAITPWNAPTFQVMIKVAPALAAGCTVILKPSELTPLSAYLLAEAIDRVGFPAGTFNLVPGVGPLAGEHLAAHRDVDLVAFTGSTRAGRRVMEVASGNIKRTLLELGGKSAALVLPDADVKQAVMSSVSRMFGNAGQACDALSRILVPAHAMDEAVEAAIQAADAEVVGDPLDEATTLGPVVSEVQRGRIRDLISSGVSEGARVVTGGIEPPAGLDRGYYLRPTVLANVENDMRVAQEEIFGPVTCLIGYRDEQHAIAMANDSRYGLSAAVWSADLKRAEAVGRRLRVGQVHINDSTYGLHSPFGGFKQSGNSRCLGLTGYEEYLELKSIQGAP